MKMVILITAQTEQSLEVASAWQAAGAKGVTIVDGNGFHRLQKKLEIRDDLPLIPSLSSLLRGTEIDTHLLISVVDDETAKQLAETTIGILGDMTLPGNGIIFSLEINSLVGLRTN